MTENNDFLTNSSLDVTQKGKQLREKILELISEYHEISHNNNKFVPGKTYDNWVWDEPNLMWKPPVDVPLDENGPYRWDQENNQWVSIKGI